MPILMQWESMHLVSNLHSAFLDVSWWHDIMAYMHHADFLLILFSIFKFLAMFLSHGRLWIHASAFYPSPPGLVRLTIIWDYRSLTWKVLSNFDVHQWMTQAGHGGHWLLMASGWFFWRLLILNLVVQSAFDSSLKMNGFKPIFYSTWPPRK